MSEQSNTSKIKNTDISRFKSLIDDLKRRFPKQIENSVSLSNRDSNEKVVLIVSINSQQLYLLKNQELHSSYLISSAEKGTGNQTGSNQTPLGIHQVSEKFGNDAPIASIFKGRKNTHQIAKILNTPNAKSTADNITSRILWLGGLEAGLNKGIDENGINVDSHARYIYIHGTDEEGRLGEAVSHGCIRMANTDVIELFNKISIGCLVIITDL